MRLLAVLAACAALASAQLRDMAAPVFECTLETFNEEASAAARNERFCAVIF